MTAALMLEDLCPVCTKCTFLPVADHSVGCATGSHSIVLLVHAAAVLQEAGQGVQTSCRALITAT